MEYIGIQSPSFVLYEVSTRRLLTLLIVRVVSFLTILLTMLHYPNDALISHQQTTVIWCNKSEFFYFCWFRKESLKLLFSIKNWVDKLKAIKKLHKYNGVTKDIFNFILNTNYTYKSQAKRCTFLIQYIIMAHVIKTG